MGYGIIWNDEIDIETETIYEEGKTVRKNKPAINADIGEKVLELRALRGISQSELSNISGIDQSDISKIERGVANPSIGTLKRIAEALDAKLVIKFEKKI